MKRLLIAGALLLGAIAPSHAQTAAPAAVAAPVIAQAANSAQNGVLSWLAKQTLMGGTFVTISSQKSPMGYIHEIQIGKGGISLAGQNPNALSFVDIDPGVISPNSGNAAFLGLVMAHPANILNSFWDDMPSWLSGHVSIAGLPANLEAGPGLISPQDFGHVKAWKFKNNFGGALSLQVPL